MSCSQFAQGRCDRFIQRSFSPDPLLGPQSRFVGTTQPNSPSSLSPQRDCGPKRVTNGQRVLKSNGIRVFSVKISLFRTLPLSPSLSFSLSISTERSFRMRNRLGSVHYIGDLPYSGKKSSVAERKRSHLWENSQQRS